MAAFFKLYQKTGSTFTIDDFGKGREIELSNFVYKEAIVSDDLSLNIKRKGVSVDPDKLPKLESAGLFL